MELLKELLKCVQVSNALGSLTISSYSTKLQGKNNVFLSGGGRER
jgi:hypothetical protein